MGFSTEQELEYAIIHIKVLKEALTISKGGFQGTCYSLQEHSLDSCDKEIALVKGHIRLIEDVLDN